MKKKVLVLGGSYFIGKRIAERLAESFDVTVLNRGSRLPPAETECIVCDRDDADSLRNALTGKRFDIAVDVSGLNARQAESLLCAFGGEAPKNFIYISSSSVYDAEGLKAPFKEDDSLGKNRYWGDYGTNKAAAERVYTDFYGKSGGALTILRPPYVYGESNYVQRESFIFEHIDAAKPILLPDKNVKLQFIYSGDLAKIAEYFCNNAENGTAAYNVGNKSAVTAKEWVEYCALACGKEARIVDCDCASFGLCDRDVFPFFSYDNVLDVTKLSSVCSYETNFTIGLKNAYEWYKIEMPEFKKNIIENEKMVLNKMGII